MSRGLYNWTAEEVIRFLKAHGFVHSHTRGSHMFFVGHTGGKPRQASVPFHGSRALKPRTMKSIIQQSGIAKERWLEK